MGTNRLKDDSFRKCSNGLTKKTFDGIGSWEEFIFQFSWRAIVNQWNEVEKAGHLVDALRGQALSLICVLGPSVTTFDQMVAALEKRYSCQGQEQDFMCQLRTRHQKPTESLTNFAVDLEILVRRALPGVTNEVIETVALQQFYDGIKDEKVRDGVVASPSSTLWEALRVSLQVEAKHARANMFQKLLNRKMGQSFKRNQRSMPISKWICSKCGEKGHIRGKCPWRDNMPRSNSNLNFRNMRNFRSLSLPETVLEGIEYGMIAKSKAPSAPDSVSVSSHEDNSGKIGNSGDDSGNSGNELGKDEVNPVTLRRVESSAIHSSPFSNV